MECPICGNEQHKFVVKNNGVVSECDHCGDEVSVPVHVHPLEGMCTCHDCDEFGPCGAKMRFLATRREKPPVKFLKTSKEHLWFFADGRRVWENELKDEDAWCIGETPTDALQDWVFTHND